MNGKGSSESVVLTETNSLLSHGAHGAESPPHTTNPFLKTSDTPNRNAYSKLSSRRKITIVLVLSLANLLNYFDRSSLSGILISVKNDFDMDNKGAALITTTFLVAYMIFSPLFGFLGDHYSRKWLIVIGLLFWSVFTLLGSYVPSTSPTLFYLTRSLVGIGEASLSTLGFPLVGDMYEGEMQSRMLALFQLALPLGNGIGYIVSTTVQKHYNNWRYVLRLTPGLGFLVSLLCAFFITDISHDKKPDDDTASLSSNNSRSSKQSNTVAGHFLKSILADLKYIFTIKSFVLSTFGLAETAFVMGIMQVWIPAFMTYAANFGPTSDSLSKLQQSAGVIFGSSCIFCGLIGTVVGSELSNFLRRRTKNAETYLCAVFLFICSFCCYFGIIFNPHSIILSWAFTFAGVFLISVTFIANSIILMSVISIHHRGLASASQILLIHAVGDAVSPFIVGMIADWLKRDESNQSKYTELYQSLLICPYFMMLAATLYLCCIFYYPRDKETMLKRDETEL